MQIVANYFQHQMTLIFNVVKVTEHENTLSIKCSFVIVAEYNGNTDCSYGRGQNLLN